VYWQLQEVVSGIATACRALDIPVVSGNVSLYNEHDAGGEVTAIFPTPVIGMVGLLDDYRTRLRVGFVEEGDFVLLLGAPRNELGGSEYLKTVHGLVAGKPPAIDLQNERAVQRFVLAANAAGLLRSAHDVSDGGMLVALAECCLHGNLGVTCPELRPEPGHRLDAAFFGESQSRFIVSAVSRNVPELQTLAKRFHVEVQMLGMAGGAHLEFSNQLKVSLDELRDAHENALLGWREVAV
jgi:phosphoribosylformylglycinamidine synthase